MAKSVHYLIRPVINIITQDGEENVIVAHNSIFTKDGRVAFGKFGIPPSSKVIDELTGQINKGIRTYLYLVTRKNDAYHGHRAPIVTIFNNGTKRRLTARHPRYVDSKVSYWFVLSGPFKKAALGPLRLFSSGREVLTVVAETRTSSMLIYRS